ncbi:MAG TPA: DUF2934 domain-containing protein [Burkholderiales bacterium]
MAVKKETERRSAQRRTEPKAAPQSTPKPASFNNTARAEVSADEVRKLISEAAYYRAKQRGFQPGHELDDWIQAEAEVARRLNSPGR